MVSHSKDTKKNWIYIYRFFFQIQKLEQENQGLRQRMRTVGDQKKFYKIGGFEPIMEQRFFIDVVLWKEEQAFSCLRSNHEISLKHCLNWFLCEGGRTNNRDPWGEVKAWSRGGHIEGAAREERKWGRLHSHVFTFKTSFSCLHIQSDSKTNIFTLVRHKKELAKQRNMKR